MVTKCAEETLQKCITCEKRENVHVPYGTVRNKVNGWHLKSSGGQTALSLNLEEAILQSLDQLTDWKVPFASITICCLVKAYLDKKRDTVLCFRQNMPGNDWLHGFIKRHNLTKRIIDNVKAARAEVNHKIINSYFDKLEQWLKDVTPNNIYNHNETNISDDPGAKLVTTRRGRNHIERKTQHSKSSVSVKFAGNAAVELLPPMVRYKSESI